MTSIRFSHKFENPCIDQKKAKFEYDLHKKTKWTNLNGTSIWSLSKNSSYLGWIDVFQKHAFFFIHKKYANCDWITREQTLIIFTNEIDTESSVMSMNKGDSFHTDKNV